MSISRQSHYRWAWRVAALVCLAVAGAWSQPAAAQATFVLYSWNALHLGRNEGSQNNKCSQLSNALYTNGQPINPADIIVIQELMYDTTKTCVGTNPAINAPPLDGNFVWTISPTPFGPKSYKEYYGFLYRPNAMNGPNQPNVTLQATSQAAYSGGVELEEIQVQDGGSGYGPGTTVVITPALGGAAANPVIEGGVIEEVEVTNPGSGYAAPPTITLGNTGGGTGAELQAILENDYTQFDRPPMAALFLITPKMGGAAAPAMARSIVVADIHATFGKVGLAPRQAEVQAIAGYVGNWGSAAWWVANNPALNGMIKCTGAPATCPVIIAGDWNLDALDKNDEGTQTFSALTALGMQVAPNIKTSLTDKRPITGSEPYDHFVWTGGVTISAPALTPPGAGVNGGLTGDCTNPQTIYPINNVNINPDATTNMYNVNYQNQVNMLEPSQYRIPYNTFGAPYLKSGKQTTYSDHLGIVACVSIP